MHRKFFCLLALHSFLYSCQSTVTETNPNSVVNLNDSSYTIQDSTEINPVDLKKSWKEVALKLPAQQIPARIDCKAIIDSVQFELSSDFIAKLLPKETIKQKDPVVSAFSNLVVDKDTVGTFYSIQYPVVYNKLTDITCQIVLVLYNENGQYSDVKTLAIQDYGLGYSKIKSVREIINLYSAEKEKVETDITVYDVSDKVSIKKVNSMHVSSGANQDEYEKNLQLIDKMMK